MNWSWRSARKRRKPESLLAPHLVPGCFCSFADLPAERTTRFCPLDPFFSPLRLGFLLIKPLFGTNESTRIFGQLLPDPRMLIEVRFEFRVLSEIVGIIQE